MKNIIEWLRLPNVSNKDVLSIRKILLHSATNSAKKKKENLSQKNSVNPEPVDPKSFILVTSTSLTDP